VEPKIAPIFESVFGGKFKKKKRVNFLFPGQVETVWNGGVGI
jgi:hypothetical protein